MDKQKGTILTLENEYGRYTASVDHSDLDVDGIMELVKNLIRAAGFAEENIRDYFGRDL